MAEIRSFKGYRYKVDKPELLGQLIAPPYDMLDAPMIDRLYGESPDNVVRIDQNKPMEADRANRDRHERAARFFNEAISGGVITADPEQSVYVYEQHFTIESAGRALQLERTGITVLVKLVDLDAGVVLPHENTLSGPKVDRYEHLDLVRANVGQIFGLVPDGGELYKMILGCRTGAPEGTATDDNGVRHIIHRCTEHALISRLREMMADRTILIADGHHRYETALKFYHDHGDDPAFGWVMMTLVSMADPGLIIRPFHRLVHRGGEGLDTAGLAQFFSVGERGPFKVKTIYDFLKGTSDEMLFADSQSKELYGLSLNAGGETYLSSTMPERSLLWKHLDVSKINMIAIHEIMKLQLDGHVLHDMIDYMNDPVAALDRLSESDAYSGGFFIRPVSIGTVRDIVAGGERMPQKSTNFYPKLFSGLVFNKFGDS